MKRIFKVTALVALSVLAVSNLAAEVVSEATLGSGYQSNLFGDSSTAGDVAATAGIGFRYFPSASTQLTAGARYHAFAAYRDLSNLTGEASFTVIPTSAMSRVSLSLAGNIAVRKFGDLYELYDQTAASAGADFTWHAAPWLHFPTAVSWLSNRYTNSDFGSSRSIDVATGVTASFAQVNTLALRLNYSRRTYDQIAVTEQGNGMRPGSNMVSENFDITAIDIRYSRPLGERTGLSLSGGYRSLQLDADYTFYGYTIDYLSPWTDLWEGERFAVGLKHFFPNQITMEFSANYADKSFADVIDQESTESEVLVSKEREDQQTAVSLNFSRPVLLKGGQQLIPSVSVGYRNNQSSMTLYDYEDISAAFSIRFSL